MQYVQIIEINDYEHTNLFGEFTTIHYNVWDDSTETGNECIAYRNRKLKGTVWGKEAKKILDMLYMTDEEYAEIYGERKDTQQLDLVIPFDEAEAT